MAGGGKGPAQCLLLIRLPMQPQGVNGIDIPQPGMNRTEASQQCMYRPIVPMPDPSSAVVSDDSFTGTCMLGEISKKQAATQESSGCENDDGGTVKQCFKCEICASEFVSDHFLQKHRQLHDAVRFRKDAPVPVDIAGTPESTRPGPVPPTWKFACQVPGCYKRLSSLARLKTHVILHTRGTDYPFLCRWCGLPCRDSDSLDQHLRALHRLFPCPLCKQQFRAELTFKSHMRSQHGRTKPFQCQWCRKTFSQQSSLRVHVRKRHPGGGASRDSPLSAASGAGKADGGGAKTPVNKRQSSSSANRTRSSSSLTHASAGGRGAKELAGEISLKVNERHSGGSANTDGGGSQALAGGIAPQVYTQVNKRHSSGTANTDPGEGSAEVAEAIAAQVGSGSGDRKRSKFQCEACGSTFYTFEGIKFHILKSPCRDVPLLCGICGRLCKSREDLLSHDTSHLPWVCLICSDRFCHSRAYARHVRAQHPGCKPYRCEQCHMTFNHHGWLKTHRRKHTGERGVLCPECGKTFIDTQTLRRHRLAVHRGARPFSCPLCHKTFRYQGALGLHRRQHETAKPFLCDECGRSFTCSQSLKVHKCAQASPAAAGDKRLASARVSSTHPPEVESEVNAETEPRKVRTVFSVSGDAAKEVTGLYSCPECSQTFTNKRSRRSHVASHGRCVCQICKRTFLTKKNRDRHICSRRDRARRFSRDGCGEAFYGEEDRAKRAQTHASIEKQRDNIQTHLSEDRQDWPPTHSYSSETHRDEVPLTQDWEDRKDQIEIRLGEDQQDQVPDDFCEDRKDQLEILLGEDQEDEVPADLGEDRKDKIAMLVRDNEQGQITSYVGEGRRGQVAVHVQDDEQDFVGEKQQDRERILSAKTQGERAEPRPFPKRFECEECGKCYRRRSDLNIHRRLHRGELSFKCSFCHVAYHSSSNLSKHMRSKHNYTRTMRTQSF